MTSRLQSGRSAGAPINGKLGQRPLSSDEAGKFLNVCLDLQNEDAVTSHTLKPTTLTWSSKYGLGEASRTLLGHHALPGSQSLACYSRDMLSRPLAKYQSMLKNIRQGYFQPDVTRSGRFVSEVQPAVDPPCDFA